MEGHYRSMSSEWTPTNQSPRRGQDRRPERHYRPMAPERMDSSQSPRQEQQDRFMEASNRSTSPDEESFINPGPGQGQGWSMDGEYQPMSPEQSTTNRSPRQNQDRFNEAPRRSFSPRQSTTSPVPRQGHDRFAEGAYRSMSREQLSTNPGPRQGYDRSQEEPYQSMSPEQSSTKPGYRQPRQAQYQTMAPEQSPNPGPGQDYDRFEEEPYRAMSPEHSSPSGNGFRQSQGRQQRTTDGPYRAMSPEQSTNTGPRQASDMEGPYRPTSQDHSAINHGFRPAQDQERTREGYYRTMSPEQSSPNPALRNSHIQQRSMEGHYRTMSPAQSPDLGQERRGYYQSMSPEQAPTNPNPIQQQNGTMVPGRKFRTAQDETIAHDMLSRNKELKIESRSRLSRVFTPKSKRAKFTDREIYRVLLSVVRGQNASPGTVEVLTDLFIEQRGDINLEPQKSGLFKKKHHERSRLLEMCAENGNVEFVQILAPHADTFSLNASLEVALRDRNSGSCQDPRRQNMMIQVLIARGANGSNTIDSAVRIGDVDLLKLLLQGRPARERLSEALPLAANFQVEATRRQLIRMLLQNGADVNHNRGEAISHVTKSFDTESLDVLLECQPHTDSLCGAFATALNLPDSTDRFDACERLIRAGASGSEVNKGLLIAVTTEHQNIEFLKLILMNASVDCENGEALCLTVINEHMEHLQLMLEKRPNQITFDSAFAAAIRLRNSREGLKYCRVLLAAGPPRDSCSRALVDVVKAQRDELCKVFLEKGASPDFDRGASITAAVTSENIGILELLIGGTYQRPHSSSLVAGFDVALSMPPSRPKKMKIIKLLLEAGVKGPSLDNALVVETRKGRDGVTLCKLFLEYGASINEQGGEALDICVRSGDLEFLLQPAQQPRNEVLGRIFQSAIKLDPRSRHRAIKLILQANMPINEQVAAAVDALVQERRPDMQTIEVLLSFGASVHYKTHQPLITAAKGFNSVLLRLLLENSQIDSASSVVFETMMKMESFWGKKGAFEILTILLECGAEGVSVNDALIRIVADAQSPGARQFEATLLQHRVDIDYKDGEALQIATERGEPGLVRRMLQMNPSMDSVSMAFPYAFHSKLGEVNTLAVIDAFVELAAEQLDPGFVHERVPEPPVFLCLDLYPTNVAILESTLRAGYPANETMTAESGKYSALYYALSSRGKRVTDPLVQLLIEQFGDLRGHPEPLIHLAIENGRSQVLQNLIDAGADIDLSDEEGVTALSTATVKNDIQSMHTLLKAKACPNDGSLHEAAQMVNMEAITLLINFGHDATLPHTRFEGRPPLFELCYRAPTYLQHLQVTTAQKEKKLKQAIIALMKGGALPNEQLPQAGNRSLLLHALDSANPYLVTKAFLECVPNKFVNGDWNLFNDGEYTYSPTMYVKKGKCRGDKTQTQSLVTLLGNLGAIDRYWKHSGPQPNDMANPPPDIQKAETERRAIEKARREAEEKRRREVEEEQRKIEAHRVQLAIEAEKEQAKQERAEKQFKQRQAQEQAMHARRIAEENDRLRVVQERDAHALRQAQSLSQLRNDENEAEHKRRLTFISEKKRLAESEAVITYAYQAGLSGAPLAVGGRKALGWNGSKSNIDLGGRRRRLEGLGSTPRITELDE